MKLNTKLIADYVEMINGELDRIPIAEKEEFELIALELQHLIYQPFPQNKDCFYSFFNYFFSAPPKDETLPLNDRLYSPLSPTAKTQLDYVRYCLTTPEDFVEKQENFVEYREIIKKRIVAKIKEFKSFNDQQKEEYMLFQFQEKNPVI